MDSSADGASKLTMDERREVVYQLSKWPGAPEVLQSWSRQEILQILCAEMGKERKYTGLTKSKIIEHLLKIVSEKQSGVSEARVDIETSSSPPINQGASKRQRKIDNPSRLPVPVVTHATTGCDLVSNVYCKNSACKAILKQDDAFCKRCSCCICRQYDDNKDPSLWLTCSTEQPYQGLACGKSCHLNCALKHEKSGITNDGRLGAVDGSFLCVACGKMNDLLGCWRKQLMVAKDTRRVDILCYRVSLSQKLLRRKGKYQHLTEIVDDAVKKLEGEVGPLTGLPVKMGRGIVNRLSSGPEVQKLCAFALDSLEKMPSNNEPNSTAHAMVRFEDLRGTSVVVVLGCKDLSTDNISGYTLWHRKVHDMDYPAEPTCTLYLPDTRFLVTGLSPDTEYSFKVVSFNAERELGTCEVPFSTGCSQDKVSKCAIERSQSPATNCSGLSNPSSVEDETNNTLYSDHIVNRVDKHRNYSEEREKIASANICSGAINCSGTFEGGALADAVPSSDEECATQTITSRPNSDVQKLDKRISPEGQILLDTPVQTGSESVPFVGELEASMPITPSKLETLKDVQGRNARSRSDNKELPNGTVKGEDPQDGSTSKRSGERQGEECAEHGSSDRDFEYYVKVIRRLECEGHIEKNFRQKFLTWYSLRASTQEMRVVKAFIDTFSNDPASLAEQLVDTFSECISSRTPSMVSSGFCMKLWH